MSAWHMSAGRMQVLLPPSWIRGPLHEPMSAWHMSAGQLQVLLAPPGIVGLCINQYASAFESVLDGLCVNQKVLGKPGTPNQCLTKFYSSTLQHARATGALRPQLKVGKLGGPGTWFLFAIAVHLYSMQGTPAH
eukprot:763249-Pelagomonas_calceolata.AAC.1